MATQSIPMLMAALALTLPVSPSSGARLSYNDLPTGMTTLSRAVEETIERIDALEGRDTWDAAFNPGLAALEAESLALGSTSPTPPPPWSGVSASATWGSAINTASLAQVRGGFDVGGLTVGIGLTRTVTQNGQVISSTVISIPDLAQMTSQQARQLNAQLGSVAGSPGSLAIAGVVVPATVVQNAMDNQKLSVSTVIDATVNSLALLKAISLNTALQFGFVNATRR